PPQVNTKILNTTDKQTVLPYKLRSQKPTDITKDKETETTQDWDKEEAMNDAVDSELFLNKIMLIKDNNIIDTKLPARILLQVVDDSLRPILEKMVCACTLILGTLDPKLPTTTVAEYILSCLDAHLGQISKTINALTAKTKLELAKVTKDANQ
ncbi:hypothetical protein C0991_000964, partial [Blastosporella zonata]